MRIRRRVSRLLLLIGIIGGACLLTLASRNVGQAMEAEPRGASAGSPLQITPTPVVTPTPAYECYSLRGGEDAQTVVRLVTKNFGGDVVRVRQLALMCEFAYKFPVDVDPSEVSAPSGQAVFACYRIQHGADPGEPYILGTENFGEDRIVVGQAVLMCEQAAKHVDNRSGPVPSSPAVWQCFALKEGDDANARKLLVTENFGRDRLVVRQDVLLCESAEKQRPQATGQIEPTGVADGRVFACFRLREGDDPNKPVTLETKNFLRDEVSVRQAVLMCEPAKKQPLYVLPPSEAQPNRLDELGIE